MPEQLEAAALPLRKARDDRDTVKCRIKKMERPMTATARFDLKLDASDKDIFLRAATLVGTSMAGFVRAAAKEKALALLDEQSRVTLSQRDFAAFSAAINNAFAPNPALKGALAAAKRVKRV